MAQQPNKADQEIDLAEVSRKIRRNIGSLKKYTGTFKSFIRKYIVFLVILFIIGAALGYYIDKKSKTYDHSIIVLPNFGSVDYLYSKIALLNSKIEEGDTLFIKNLGLKSPKKLAKIKIEPINNVYDFVNQRPTNFELLKLMAEDGNVEKVVEGNVTSKNYPNHLISFSTQGITNKDNVVVPLMKYLNNSSYFDILKKEQIKNVEIKLQLNDSVLKQIDGILEGFSAKNLREGSKSSNLVYYSENTELSEVLKRKDELINEQASLRISKINYDKTVKDTSVTLNQLNKHGLNGKRKFVFPVLLIVFFSVCVGIIGLLRRKL